MATFLFYGSYLSFSFPFMKRIAVSVFFAVSGFIHANWTARLPELEHFLGITHAELGLQLFLIALGAMVAMPLTGWLTGRWGSRRLTLMGGIFFCFMVPFIAVYPAALISTLFFSLMGFFNGILNVSMNGQAVLVERLAGKVIMSSFHALFSIGLAMGALSGALFARFGIPLFIHFVMISLTGLVLMIIAFRYLEDDKPEVRPGKKERSRFLLPARALLPLGFIGFCSMTAEGSMSDWSAIYMNQVVGQSATVSALAFGVFGVAMTIGRAAGDYLTGLVGKFRLLVYSTLIAICGLGLVLLVATPWTSMLGFFLIGIGLATVVPIIYSTAGNVENVLPSVGIAMVTSMGYAGFFIGPPVIGFLADFAGLRAGLGYSLFLLIVMGLILWLSGIRQRFAS